MVIGKDAAFGTRTRLPGARRPLRSPGLPGAITVLAFLLAGAVLAPAVADEMPRLVTHESYVNDVVRQATLPVDDMKAMFTFVLGSLPNRVKVYPTENYYYFRFASNGAQYAGNIRLDASDRDQGKLHFAYYEDLAEWKEESPVKHIVLDADHGVGVQKLDKLLYRVSFGEKTVEFELNDLSKAAPPKEIVGVDEVYIGPIFDESAISFFLVFNTRLKIFHYILDETVKVADTLVPAKSTDRILIGNRTGFAYYRDGRLDRKILIGVFEGNARVNNYFDGPFDQMPDNFLEGDALSKRIVEVEPRLKGKIDRFGGSGDGASRFMIAPYVHYRSEEDLMVFHDCATDKKIRRELYHACFVVETQDEDVESTPRRDPSTKKQKRRQKARAAGGSAR